MRIVVDGAHEPIEVKLYRLGHCQMSAWILWTLQLLSASGSNREDDLLEMVSIVVEVVGEESAVFRDMP